MRYEKALAQGPLVPSPVENWGIFTRFLEIADDGFAARHVDEFQDGRFLRYDRMHWVDDFGMLADARLVNSRGRSREKGVGIEATEFETVWEIAGRSPEWQNQIATAKMNHWEKILRSPNWARQFQVAKTTRVTRVPPWLRPKT